jgi:hypothetical protein
MNSKSETEALDSGPVCGPAPAIRGICRIRGWSALGPAPAALCALALLLSGCLSLKLQTPDTPLPPRDLKLRTQTREYATLSAELVRNAADAIAERSRDRQVRDQAVRWKIAASAALRNASLHTDPVLALADSWGLARQMAEFFGGGAGSNLFGARQPLALTNAQALAQRAADLARGGLSPAEFSQMEKFVGDYAARYPLRDLSLAREPVAAHWTGFGTRPAKPTVGSMAEAMNDLADRVTMMGQQVPEEVRWRVELGAGQLDDGLTQARAAADRLDRNLQRIAAVAENTPPVVTNAVATAVRELRESVLPSLDRLEKQWGSTIASLRQEREGLARDIASERAALVTAVGEQRLAIMKEFDKTAQGVTDRTLQQARGMVRDALFYVVLLVAVVLGFPFGFGFLAGRMSARKPARKDPPAGTGSAS